jgi:putative hemolysin
MYTFFIIIISLAVSFFFSGMEIAYVSSNKLQLHVDSQKESLSGRLFARITNSPVRFLITLLLGNTLALVVFGVFTAKVLDEVFSHYGLTRTEILVIQTLITTSVILVAADFIPKNLFRFSPNRFLKLFSLPCILLYYILLPFTLVVLSIAQFLTEKLFGESLFKHKNTFTKTDLYGYLDEHSNQSSGNSEEEESEVQMFKNALAFPDVKVRDCMVARLDVISMDITEGVEKLREKFLQTGLSRILIYGGSLDNILGYVHFHKIFKDIADIQAMLMPAPLIPESMLAKDALRIFMQQHKSMAVIVDEFGVTSGILTTEDIIEEIFGEIDDEYDKEELLEKKLSKGEYLFSARLEIDYLNQKYNLNLPVSADYTTLGGLILHITGSIPKAKKHISIDDFSFRIVSSSQTRIEQVLLTSKKQSA